VRTVVATTNDGRPTVDALIPVCGRRGAVDVVDAVFSHTASWHSIQLLSAVSLCVIIVTWASGRSAPLLYLQFFVFGSSVNIRRWTYVRRNAMAQKLFSTGPGSFRRAERKEAIDSLDRTSCVSICSKV